jgi:hypothetical protein
MTVLCRIAACAEEYADRPALIAKGQPYSYREVVAEGAAMGWAVQECNYYVVP